MNVKYKKIIIKERIELLRTQGKTLCFSNVTRTQIIFIYEN